MRRRPVECFGAAESETRVIVGMPVEHDCPISQLPCFAVEVLHGAVVLRLLKA